MRNFLLAFLSRNWAGLALAAIAALAGLSVLAVARAGPIWATSAGYAAVGFAALLAIGSARHLAHVARMRRKYPPPGRLVDVGGYRLHVLAEGEARGKPAIVWMPGGHAAGYHFHHLHEMLRGEARSILIDRPGTGWSDVGPFPRTTAGEAVEVITALERSGEPGPFVFAGSSFGGLLVANVARRRPDLVAALILLDATPPDTIVYGPPHGLLTQNLLSTLRAALPRLFGFYPASALPPADDDFDRDRLGAYARVLGSALTTVNALEAGPSADLAMASARAELSSTGMAKVGWDTVVYRGDLGDMPVFVVTPRDMSEAEFQQVWKPLAKRAGTGRAAEAFETRARRFYLASRKPYLTTSTRAEQVFTPEGTTHIFPWEAPEFVADVVRRAQSIQ